MNTVFSISVIIPVLNEAGRINGLIDHLRSLKGGDQLQIIVSDGDPAGSTLQAVTDPRTIAVAGPAGRGRQMNAGAARADGEVLLFLHADTTLPGNALALIDSALRDGRSAAGAFSLGIDSPRWYFRVTERYVALRTLLTRIPFGDQAIFVRRPCFEDIGGFRDIPIMEDVELMSRIRGRGDAICIVPAKVVTSARRWENEGVLFATLRNWSLQLLYCIGVPAVRLARFYRKHG